MPAVLIHFYEYSKKRFSWWNKPPLLWAFFFQVDSMRNDAAVEKSALAGCEQTFEAESMLPTLFLA